MSRLCDDIPTMHHTKLRSQAPSSSAAILEFILEQRGLGTLLERFSSEKVDPEVVLSMPDSSLICLGVETLGDRIRIKERCKQYVEGDNRGETFTSSFPAQQVAEERRMLFQPYSSHRGQGSRTAKADRRKNHPDVRGRASSFPWQIDKPLGCLLQPTKKFYKKLD